RGAHRAGKATRAGDGVGGSSGAAAASPARARLIATDATRRFADAHGVVGQVAGDARARADDHVLADVGTAEDECAVTQPRAGADAHRARRRELPADGLVAIRVAVVGVGDVHVVAGPHVVADLDAPVADDATPLPDHAAVAD